MCSLFQSIKAIAIIGENLDFYWNFVNLLHFELCALPFLHEFDTSVEKLPVIFAVYNLFVD